MIDYVVGFLFTPDRKIVTLIRKNRPSWQAGKLNGIGGKINPGEKAEAAMVREFHEEAGAKTGIADWDCFSITSSEQWRVFFFRAFAIFPTRTMESEEVVDIDIENILNRRVKCCDQVYWLIPMAIDLQMKGSIIKYRYSWEDPNKICSLCSKPQIECRCF